MKKFIPLITIFVLVLCFALVPTFISGFTASVHLPKEDRGYEITAYDVNIKINEDGSFDVKEKLDVHFNALSHGIYRWLPLVQSSTYRNPKGKAVKKNFRSTVTNVMYDSFNSSSGTYIVDTFKENGNYFLQMGSNTSYVTAGSNKTYAFSYTYNFGNDREKTMDMLYYNIVGTGWDTSISNLTFKITFPKELKNNDVEFYVGRYGESSANSDRVSYTFEDGVLQGYVAELRYGEAVTVFKELEEGYFNYSTSHILDFVLIAIVVLIVLFTLILFLVKRKKDAIVEVVEFKAPDGLTPTEAGLINDGKVTGDDISSLIVYWASKKFVKIKEEDGSTKIERIIKEEELEGKMKTHERILFDDMFRSGRQIVEAKDLDLSQNTGARCQKSVSSATKDCFDGKTDTHYTCLLSLAVALLAIFAFKNIYQSVFVGFTAILQVVFAAVSIVGLLLVPTLMKYRNKCKKRKFIFLLVLTVIAIFASLLAQICYTEAFCDAFGVRFYISFVLVFLVVVYPFLETYTKKGREILGRIRGLKHYILVAEKDKMEMLVNENPQLFYDVLPYAYVLGVSDVYMKKFEDVKIIQPSNPESPFDTWVGFVVINNCVNSVSTSIRKNISAGVATQVGKAVGTISSHIGGGSGGHSGGGHGGGGGGRW